MNASFEQRTTAEQWLQEKMKHRSCTVCEATDWAIGDLVTLRSSDIHDDVAGGNPTMIQVVCRSCAHVLLFDVRRMPNCLAHETIHAAFM
jgi:hypothetical protein